VIVIYYAVKKKPTIPGMLIASFVASFLGMIIQGNSLGEYLTAMALGYKSQTGVEVVDNLISRGGMAGMMHVTLIAFCAFAFAGIAQSSGMLDVILQNLLKVARKPGSLIAATVASCVSVALMTGRSFLSILIPGELFAPAFRQMNLAAKNLSRTTEDSGTVVVPLIPWSMAGVFMAGTLGVPTLNYAPWAFMCYLGMVFALIYGFTGFAIAPRIREDETIPGS
jgi:NhaC family Na+:H+ antiporter